MNSITEHLTKLQKQWDEQVIEHKEVTDSLKNNYNESLTAKENENQQLIRLHSEQLERESQRSKETEEELNEQITIIREKFDQSIAENLSSQQKYDNLMEDFIQLKKVKDLN
jgi:hypothetical protein